MNYPRSKLLIPPDTDTPASETSGVGQIVLKVFTLFLRAGSWRGAGLVVIVTGAAVGQLTGSGTTWDLSRTIEAEECDWPRKKGKTS